MKKTDPEIFLVMLLVFVKDAAVAVGDRKLQGIMMEASATIRRDIVSAASTTPEQEETMNLLNFNEEEVAMKLNEGEGALLVFVKDAAVAVGDRKLQGIMMEASATIRRDIVSAASTTPEQEETQELEELKKYTDIANFKTEFAIVYERNGIKRKRDKYRQLSCGHLPLYSEYQRRLMVLRELNYIDEHDSVTVKGRVACGIRTHQLMITELVFRDVFTDMPPAEIAALISGFVFKGRIITGYQVYWSGHTKLDEVLKIAAQIEKELIAIESKYSVDQSQGLDGELNFTLSKHVYEWSLQRPFNEIMVIPLASEDEGTIVRCIKQVHELLVNVIDSAVAVGDLKLQAIMTEVATAIRRDIVCSPILSTQEQEAVQELEELKKYTDIANFKTEFAIVYERNGIKRKRDKYRQLSCGHLPLYSEYQRRLMVLRELNYIDEHDSVTVKGRVACGIRTHQLMITELVFRDVFTDMPPAEIAALISGFVFKGRIITGYQVYWSGHTKLDEVLKIAAQIEKELIAIESKYSVDQSQGLDGELNFTLSKHVYEWSLQRPFNEIMVIPLASEDEGTIVRCIKQVHELLVNVIDGAVAVGDLKLQAIMTEVATAIRRDIVCSPILSTQEQEAVQELEELKKYTDIANFKTEFAIVYERNGIKRKRDKYRQLSCGHLPLYSEYQRRLMVLRELNYIDEHNSVTVKGRVACGIRTHQLMITELVFRDVFTDMPPAEIAALISGFVFKGRIITGYQVYWSGHTKLDEVLKIAAQIEKELIAIESKYSVDQSQGLDGELNFTLSKHVYEWSLQRPFNEIMVIPLASEDEGTIVRCIKQVHELLVNVIDSAVAVGDLKLQAIMTEVATAIRRDIVCSPILSTQEQEAVQELEELKKYTDIANFKTEFAIVYERNGIKRKRDKYRQLSCGHLPLYSEYQRRLMVLRELNYIDEHNSVTVKGRVACGIRTHQLMITELVFRDVFTDMPPAEIAALISGFVFKGRIITGYQVYWSGHTKLDEVLKIAAQIEKELIAIESKYSVDQSQGLDGELNFTLSKHVYEWSLQRPFNEIMVIPLASEDEGTIVRCIKQVHELLVNVIDGAVAVGDLKLQAIMTEVATAIRRDIVCSPILSTQEQEAVQELEELKKYTDIANFKTEFAIVYERNGIKRKRDKYRQLSCGHLPLYSEYQRRLMVLRELNYIDEHDSVTVKGRVACGIRTHQLMITELVFRDVFTDMPPAEIAALISGFVFKGRIITGYQVYWSGHTKLDEVLKIAAQIEKELIAIESKYSVDQSQGLDGELNFTLSKHVYEWSLQRPFNEIMVIPLASEDEGTIVRCIKQVHELLVNVIDGAVAVGDRKLQAIMTEVATAIRRDIVCSPILSTQEQEAVQELEELKKYTDIANFKTEFAIVYERNGIKRKRDKYRQLSCGHLPLYSEYQRRLMVLRELNYIDEHDSVTVKGRVACGIRTHQLMITELVFRDVFTDMPPAEIAALISGFVFKGRIITGYQVYWSGHTKLDEVLKIAAQIEKELIAIESKYSVDQSQGLDGELNFTLSKHVYEWSLQRPFNEIMVIPLASEDEGTIVRCIKQVHELLVNVIDGAVAVGDLKLQAIMTEVATAIRRDIVCSPIISTQEQEAVQELEELKKYTDIANFKTEFAIVYERNGIKRKRDKYRQLSCGHLPLYSEYQRRLMVLRELNYIDEHDSVTVKGRVACGIRTHQLMITELVFRDVFTDMPPAEIAALISGFVFKGRIITGYQVYWSGHTKLDEVLKIAAQIEKELIAIESKYSVDQSQGLDGELNFILSKHVYEWALQRPFNEIMVIPLASEDEGTIVRCIKQVHELLVNVIDGAVAVGDLKLQAIMTEVATAIRRDIVCSPILSTQEQEAVVTR